MIFKLIMIFKLFTAVAGPVFTLICVTGLHGPVVVLEFVLDAVRPRILMIPEFTTVSLP